MSTGCSSARPGRTTSRRSSALLHEDVIREIDESEVPASSYAAAFEEIRADAHQDLLVGEVDGEVVATAQLTWVRHLTYVGGLMCVVESVRVRSDLRGRGWAASSSRTCSTARGPAGRPGSS